MAAPDARRWGSRRVRFCGAPGAPGEGGTWPGARGWDPAESWDPAVIQDEVVAAAQLRSGQLGGEQPVGRGDPVAFRSVPDTSLTGHALAGLGFLGPGFSPFGCAPEKVW